MPNHITNIIRADAPTLDKIKFELEGDESAVDFNALVPMPVVLKNDGTKMHIESLARFIMNPKRFIDAASRQPVDPQGAIDGLTANNVVRDMQHRPEPIDWNSQDFEDLIKYMLCLREHGHADWYSWAIQHWGTKWNAYDVTVEEDCIRFDTAWSCPDPIVLELAKAVPGDWTWEYADEDIGHNCGTFTCTDGNVGHAKPEGEDDATRFACAIKGLDYEEWKLDVGM